jgi:hypothetical protein
MSYSEFTLKKVRDDFGLTLVEGDSPDGASESALLNN